MSHTPRLGVVSRQRWAVADQISIAENAVDSRDRRPVLVSADGIHGIGSELTAVGVRPLTRRRLGCVWCMPQRVVIVIPLAGCDLCDLAANRGHRFDEAVQ